jgi:hypothetical protein
MAGNEGTPPGKANAGGRSWTPLMTAAAVAVAMLVGYGLCGLRPMTTLSEQQAEKSEAAIRIRASAKQTCEQGLYRDCLRLYDEAKRFDPQGDLAPEIEQARRSALDALEAGVRDGEPPSR